MTLALAYDNDQQGNLMAQRAMEQLPNCVRRIPKAIDWNQELKNMFNLEQKLRQQEYGQHQAGGLSL